MTESEAREKAIKVTDYCYVLACVWQGEPNDSICLERIFVKGGCEEIRFAWWTKGKQAMRPADLDAPEWVPLFGAAIKAGVFTEAEQLGMVRALLS